MPVVLLVLALLLWWLAAFLRQSSGVPTGKVVRSDTWFRVEKPLYSRALGLTGQPDYVVQTADGYVPVEVKSGQAPPRGPYPAHVFQLAAYCALVTEAYGRPAYGLIQYADRVEQVAYTPKLERDLHALLAEMRHHRTAPDVARSHNAAARCRGCGLNEVCEQRLE